MHASMEQTPEEQPEHETSIRQSLITRQPTLAQPGAHPSNKPIFSSSFKTRFTLVLILKPPANQGELLNGDQHAVLGHRWLFLTKPESSRLAEHETVLQRTDEVTELAETQADA